MEPHDAMGRVGWIFVVDGRREAVWKRGERLGRMSATEGNVMKAVFKYPSPFSIILKTANERFSNIENVVIS